MAWLPSRESTRLLPEWLWKNRTAISGFRIAIAALMTAVGE